MISLDWWPLIPPFVWQNKKIWPKLQGSEDSNIVTILLWLQKMHEFEEMIQKFLMLAMYEPYSQCPQINIYL